MVVAQISDLHISVPGRLAFGRIDTTAHLERCVRNILHLRPLPDAVVASGDLVDTGVPEEYSRLRQALSPLSMPVYLMPGNHDERSALRAAFRDHDYLPKTGLLHYAIDNAGLRLIMLDTVVPGAVGGQLDARQQEWLGAMLRSAPHRPTIIFMHHPPIMSGIQCMDEISLAREDASRLGALLMRSPQVERVSCGHVHRAIESRWSGTVVGVCPSTAFQGILALDKQNFDLSPGEPPAYQVHCWNGTQLVTHTVAVGA